MEHAYASMCNVSRMCRAHSALTVIVCAYARMVHASSIFCLLSTFSLLSLQEVRLARTQHLYTCKNTQMELPG